MREMEQVVLKYAYQGNWKAITICIIVFVLLCFVIWFKEKVKGNKRW